jgi:hypothetical protein
MQDAALIQQLVGIVVDATGKYFSGTPAPRSIPATISSSSRRKAGLLPMPAWSAHPPG